jgi:O-antigen ligase
VGDAALSQPRLTSRATIFWLLPIASIGLMGFGHPLLALAGVVGFTVSVAVRPWIAIPAIVLTLPFYLHPQVSGGIEVSVTEATILLSVVGVIARTIAERTNSPLPNPPPRQRQEDGLTPSPSTAEGGRVGSVQFPAASAVDWAVAAFLLAALLSLLVTEYPRQSVRELRWLIVEPILVLYLARATIRTSDQIRHVVWSVVAAGLIATLASLVALALTNELLSPLARATQPYLSPNHLGLFLGRAAAVALAIALFAPAHARLEKRAAWLAAGALAAGLLRTMSLGAWAGLAAAALAMSALRGRRWLLGTAAVLGVGLLVAVAVLPAGRTMGRLDPSTGTALFRLQIWTASLHMIADHPVLGIGLDNFLYRYRAGYMLPEAAEEPNISHPHNWVLNFWLELGLLGLAAGLGTAVWTIVGGRDLVRRPRSRDDRVVGAAAIGVFVDTLVHGFIDNSYFLVDAAVVWWLFVALVVISIQNPVARNRAAEPVT